MNETVPAKYSTGVLAGIQPYFKTKRAAFVRRVAVVLLLLYFAVMVDAGNYVGWSIWHESYFSAPGNNLFPIPFKLPPGYLIAEVIVELDFLQTFIYVVFIGQWIWIAWMSLGIIYIMMPIVLKALGTLRRPNMKSTPAREDVGVLTKLVAVLVVLLSVITYSGNLENYGLLPLIVVLGLSTVIIGFILIDVKNFKLDGSAL